MWPSGRQTSWKLECKEIQPSPLENLKTGKEELRWFWPHSGLGSSAFHMGMKNICFLPTLMMVLYLILQEWQTLRHQFIQPSALGWHLPQPIWMGKPAEPMTCKQVSITWFHGLLREELPGGCWWTLALTNYWQNIDKILKAWQKIPESVRDTNWPSPTTTPQSSPTLTSCSVGTLPSLQETQLHCSQTQHPVQKMIKGLICFVGPLF